MGQALNMKGYPMKHKHKYRINTDCDVAVFSLDDTDTCFIQPMWDLLGVKSNTWLYVTAYTSRQALNYIKRRIAIVMGYPMYCIELPYGAMERIDKNESAL